MSLPYTEHPQSAAPREKIFIMTTAEYKRKQESIDIMDEVNQELDDIVGKKLFAIVGDPNLEGFKMRSFWIKVKTVYGAGRSPAW